MWSIILMVLLRYEKISQWQAPSDTLLYLKYYRGKGRGVRLYIYTHVTRVDFFNI